MVNSRYCVWLAACCISSAAVGDVTGVPALSSRPGAAYTLYLDFGGFNFAGTWASTGLAPGNIPAFGNVTGNFNAADQAKIQEVWVRAAQKYTPFNINVTTIDPAIAANQASTDSLRQAYYDQTAQLTHTVIADGTWYGANGGVSYVGLASAPWTTAEYNGGAGAGWHTDFVFTNYLAASLMNIGEAAAHEAGHTLNLYHQSDYSGSTVINAPYSSGNSAYAPIMGNAYSAARGAWRVGDSYESDTHTQNDVAVLVANPGLGGYVADGIGHTRLAATPLPLLGGAVDAGLAKGIIVPLSSTAPNPIGASHYTSDVFSFHADGTLFTLTVNDGSEFLTTGIADPGATLRSTLSILDSAGNVVAAGIEAASTFSESYSGILTSGDYFAVISSYGGESQTLAGDNPTQYYDMGSYFLTGSGLAAVPEPGIMLLGVMALGLMSRRRRA